MPTNHRNGWQARSYSKHARDGRVHWRSRYLGYYKTYEEARLVEIISKMDSLADERGQLVAVLEDDALQRVTDGASSELLRQCLLEQDRALFVGREVSDQPRLPES